MAFGLDDGGSPYPLGAHLAGHCLQDGRRGLDLSYLHVGHLHAPSFGDVVQLYPERVVHLLALGEDVVEGHVAHYRSQRGGGDVRRCAPQVLDRQDGSKGVEHLVKNDEIDRYGSIVLGDRRLMRDLEVPLSQVHQRSAVCHRVDEDQPGPRAPEARPNRNRTTRWYSRTILIETAARTINPTSTTATMTSMAAVTVPPFLGL